MARASYTVALVTGLRSQELVRLRASDASLGFGVLTATAPTAGAPRLLPVESTLVGWLDSLVDALRRTVQAERPRFSLWSGTALATATPRRLRTFA